MRRPCSVPVTVDKGAIRRLCATERGWRSHEPARPETARATPPRKGASRGQCPAEEAQLDPRQGTGGRGLPQDPPDHARAQAGHGLRRGGLPQCRRMLVSGPCHDDDHGRDLHPGLHLLQRGDGASAGPRPVRAGARGRRGAEAGAEPRCHHLGRSRRPCRWRGGAFRHDHPRDPQTRARHHDRDPDAGLPEVR
jgi:hypothetical protein